VQVRLALPIVASRIPERTIARMAFESLAVERTVGRSPVAEAPQPAVTRASKGMHNHRQDIVIRLSVATRGSREDPA
jgi:hypothetical protein